MYQVFGTVCRVFYTEYCGGNHRCKLGTSLFSKPHFISGRYYEKVFALCDYRKMDFKLNELIPCSEEWSNIHMAMKTRGISMDFYNFVHRPLLTIEYFFVPLFVSVMEIGDELSQSAIVRGIDAPVTKTCRHRIRMKTGDYMLLSLFSFALGIVVFLRFLGYWL